MFDSQALVAQPPTHEDRILPWLRVRDIAGISRTTAWRLQNIGDFPRPVMLSPGRVGWRESDVRAWRASRVPRGQPAPAPLFEPCSSPPPEGGLDGEDGGLLYSPANRFGKSSPQAQSHAAQAPRSSRPALVRLLGFARRAPWALRLERVLSGDGASED